jgi:malonyl CoA-acyl carrier protein transacylase
MEQETKHTALRFPIDTFEKLKYIAWYNRDSFSNVVLTGAEDQIKKFEKANGTITDSQLKELEKKQAAKKK